LSSLWKWLLWLTWDGGQVMIRILGLLSKKMISVLDKKLWITSVWEKLWITSVWEKGFRFFSLKHSRDFIFLNYIFIDFIPLVTLFFSSSSLDAESWYTISNVKP
jgi:hypothetical protein